MSFDRLAIIIPVGPEETCWRLLLRDLAVLGPESEVIVVFADRLLAEPVPEMPGVHYIAAPQGRASQLNAGAAATEREMLWFLHADTRLHNNTLQGVERCLAESRDGLFYFDLKFAPDGPRWMVLNEWGARIRSRLLKMPFGDQGFLIKRRIFQRVGGFATDIAFGEDHQFVWDVARAGYPSMEAGECLFTSARKYRDHGWARTTWRHQMMTYSQALPEMWKTWTQRLSRKGSL